MLTSKSIKGYEKLKQIFANHLNVDLLAEEMTTCSLAAEADEVKGQMNQMDFDLFGVEDEGKIVGYIKRDDLGKGKIADHYQPFRAEDLISDSTSIIDLLSIFQQRDFIFILETNKVTKIVTMADLHKQPIRMLAFSLISLLEMYLISLIQQAYPHDSWKEILPEKRLKMAEEILQKRIEKNEGLTLIDSTQLADKGTIVIQTPILLEQLGFNSKTECKNFFKNIEYLRNNTAHSQEIIYHDNRELIEVMLQIKRVLEYHSDNHWEGYRGISD